MTPGQATQAQANVDDGWPYPDNDADLKEDRRDDLEGDTDPAVCWGTPCDIWDGIPCGNPAHDPYTD